MTSGSLSGAVDDESLLVVAARAGDENAFATLWATAQRPAFGVCYHLTENRADALDALQDTQLAAWKGLATFEGKAPFRAWVLAIARNAALAVIRRRSPAGGIFDELAEDSVVTDPFEDTVAELTDLRRAMSTLPGSHREALLLWAGGLTYEQVAASIGVPLNTVKVWIHRARKKLQSELAEPGLA
ncbi:RNA polymerase sigma factor [Planobispora longispora]|uniref:DNA-directed RNA polymerase sigma-70 factor n=1 Tax=Planobispora longispora TaxID=28887 RepID=A0A8J3RNI9_9ACTN|nr:RNA polymerase sigma factor [Planobispora longispora]GIH77022.1 DNA-directed RNA polymerase sigma-70 factor [Planobispora longispora]